MGGEERRTLNEKAKTKPGKDTAGRGKRREERPKWINLEK